MYELQILFFTISASTHINLNFIFELFYCHMHTHKLWILFLGSVQNSVICFDLSGWIELKIFHHPLLIKLMFPLLLLPCSSRLKHEHTHTLNFVCGFCLNLLSGGIAGLDEDNPIGKQSERFLNILQKKKNEKDHNPKPVKVLSLAVVKVSFI